MDKTSLRGTYRISSAPLIVRHRFAEVGEIVSNFRQWSSRVCASELYIEMLARIIWRSTDSIVLIFF